MSNGYAAYAFGTVPYIGGIAGAITPEDLQVGIPFMAGNDRYQVVVCADKGTTASSPQFRYWFANGQQWGHELATDTHLPDYFSLDEDGETVVGELQLAPRLSEQGQKGRTGYEANILVDKIVVDFIPRPTAITSETVSSSEPLGFTGHVEGYGLTDYSRTVSATTPTFSGTAVSDDFTYTSSCGEHASDTWPNMRSVALPVRFDIRCRSIRVVLNEIRHVEILRVALLGSIEPSRET